MLRDITVRSQVHQKETTGKVNKDVGERGLGVISWSRQEQVAGWISRGRRTIRLGQDFSSTALGTFGSG